MKNNNAFPSLPNTWSLVRLGDFVISEKGKKPKYENNEKTSVFNIPYIDIQAFEKGVIKSWTDGKGCKLSNENDFLMVWDGSRSGLVGKGVKGALGSTLVRINFPHIYNPYAYYFLKSKFLEINTRAKGSGTPHVDPDLLWNYDFPIPPYQEQVRIVAKIEELFSELDGGLECLQKAQELLNVYRHLLLKNAFEGNLTKKWRKTVDCKLINTNLDSSKNNFKNFPPPPPNWVWVTLDAIGDLICGQSPSISQVNYEGKGYLYVTGPEQWNGKEIKQTKWTEFPTRIAPSNSIFITVKGAGVGKLFPGTDCVIGRDIYAFCPFKSMNHKFVFYSLLYGINKVILKAKGDIPGLSKSHILDHTIGLPPLEEQNLIVEILESKFLSIKEIENELKDGTDQILLLRQSILKKAFSGKLVHQNPNGEPAYILLERIKSEQLNLSKPQTKSKKKQKVLT